MRFKLDCAMKLSKPVEADIKEIIASAADLLKKGAPDGEGAVIEKCGISGDEIQMTITSGRYVRPHNAVFRLKNHLCAELGKRYKVGVREIHGKRYTIEFELENEPKKEIKIPYAEVSFSGKKCKLDIKNVDENFLQDNFADRMINLVKEKADAELYEGKGEHWELLWEGKKRDYKWAKDPTKEMEKLGWIMHRGRGQWIFGPTVTRIIKTFESIVVDELIKPLGFEEVIIPKAVTWDVWKRSGHAKSIYPEVYFLCPPQTRDKEFWEDITDEFKITGEVPAEKIKEKIKAPIGGVSYAQCPPLWPYFAGKTIADDSLPIKVFDRSGPSMRYESGGIHGIERVDEFHRIEIVWIDKEEKLMETHAKLLEAYRHIFNDILLLECRIARVTPWFMAQEGMIGVSEKKDVGTTDFESYLPYKGRDSPWLEFQNLSNNGDKYPKGFNVKAQHGELWSGCTGIGLERWLATFTAQHGLDPAGWPKEFAKRAGKLPDGIKFL